MVKDIKRVNVELPVEVHKAVKKRAIDEEVTMKAWIVKAVREAVETRGKEKGVW